MWWVVGAVAVVALLSAYLLWTASRVERLHQRAAAAARGLDAHLLRRAAAAAVLAEARGAMELYAVARIALDAGPEEQEAAENDLTRQLRALPDELAEDLAPASRRLALARQVHTDLVRDALAARRRPVVRLFRMARKHPAPAYFDIGDPILTPAEIPAQGLPVETATP